MEEDEIAEEEEKSADEAIKALELGDTLPSLTLLNEKMEEINVGEITGEKGAVLFLVPRANTPGCTTQACNFRDSYAGFEELGYSVFCISTDTPQAQAKWQTKNNLPYSLLSDPKRVLIKALGASSGKTTKRSHFVFEKGTGKLVEQKIGVKPADRFVPRLLFS
ncbi:hypothetical protein BOTBODRAFT_106548 [Botryobasidium botryosum FD-172 SS1]|uniref:thioredoxin-dependent peroxiredoxin n=1 Tax=Botryobasidium botryosum (strain FD-172 SS1) TaxID=930990 RepID=A0A067MM68_BOTB1|nr:hypothetical protein BOTBODRAFT_106548 [Botryobasidium botryosum FD-172 SS1]